MNSLNRCLKDLGMIVLNDCDIYVQLIDLPTTIRAFTKRHVNDTYTIVINSKLNDDMRLKTYEHELHHIKNDDFEKKDLSIDKIELQAHGLDIDTVDLDLKDEYPNAYAYMERLRKRRCRKKNPDSDRTQYISENCDMFERAEKDYLYGKDL